MPFYYTHTNGITKSLQQTEGALEFQHTGDIQLNGILCSQYEVREYDAKNMSWPHVGRCTAKVGPNKMQRAVNYWLYDCEEPQTQHA